MKIKKLFLVLGVVLALGVMVGPAFAYDVLATPVVGGTEDEVIMDGLIPVGTITYQSDYEVIPYILFDDIRLDADVSFVSAAGYTINSVTYVTAYLRVKGNNFTPKNGVKNGVTGSWGSTGDAYIDFEFSQLKDANGGAIGNAHFHMEYDVTWTPDGGDPVTETVKFGMNCHAEE